MILGTVLRACLDPVLFGTRTISILDFDIFGLNVSIKCFVTRCNLCRDWFEKFEVKMFFYNR